jgi:hypothetical protein
MVPPNIRDGDDAKQLARHDSMSEVLMNRNPSPVLCALALAGVILLSMVSLASAQSQWYTGMRGFGQSTVEPAIDDMTGQEVFLLTPNKAPFPSKAPDAAQAPLYLVAYPTTSTITDALNCTPTTCDHAQRVPFPWYPDGGLLKGHDHLVGIANTHGDYNVAWDVELDAFTQQGFADGAINTRILTLEALNDAKAKGDIMAVDIHTVFNCSSTNIATYLRGTPLSFNP